MYANTLKALIACIHIEIVVAVVVANVNVELRIHQLGHPTSSFTILEAQNAWIDEVYVV